jgi:DNA mismatch endonuclease (patch repair protein)
MTVLNNLVTTEQRSQIMSKIRSKDTKPEMVLRRLLWQLNIRYRIHNKKLPGKPDISISKYKLAVFIDGEFWHGKDWQTKKDTIKSNREYWIPKIEKNMARDYINNKAYEKMGWRILRFWDKDVQKNPGKCLKAIIDILSTEVSYEYNY